MFGVHRGEAADFSIARTTRCVGAAAGLPRKISRRAAPSAAVTSAPKITWLSGEIEGTPISEKVPPPGASSPTVAIITSAPSAPLAQIVEVRSVAGATLSGSGPASVRVIALAWEAASIKVTASATAYRNRRKIITEKPHRNIPGREHRPPRSANLDPFVASYGAALTIASVVKKFLSTAPMLMYQHSRSGVCRPGK